MSREFTYVYPSYALLILLAVATYNLVPSLMTMAFFYHGLARFMSLEAHLSTPASQHHA